MFKVCNNFRGEKWPYIIHLFRSQNQLCNDEEPPILKEPKTMTNDEALFELNILRLSKIITQMGMNKMILSNLF